MSSLLFKIGKLPATIIFMFGKKQSKLRIRWAPAKLMQNSKAFMFFDDETASCPTTGLVGNYTVLKFDETVLHTVGAWYVQLKDMPYGFKVCDTTLDEHEENAIPIPFSCCALLVKSEISLRLDAGAAALLRPRTGDEDPVGPIVICEYKRRLVIQMCTMHDFEDGAKVVTATPWLKMPIKIV